MVSRVSNTDKWTEEAEAGAVEGSAAPLPCAQAERAVYRYTVRGVWVYFYGIVWGKALVDGLF